FEQSVGIDQKSAMSLGGALGGPMTAFQYDWNMLPIGQQLWLEHLLSYEKFPPLQKPSPTTSVVSSSRSRPMPVTRMTSRVRRGARQQADAPTGVRTNGGDECASRAIAS